MNAAESRALLPTAALGVEVFMVMGGGVKRDLGRKLSYWDTPG